jgi:hypothetical protein
MGIGGCGVVDTKARELDGEGSEHAGWGLRREEGPDEAIKGMFNLGKSCPCGIGVGNDALDKLPLLLE